MKMYIMKMSIKLLLALFVALPASGSSIYLVRLDTSQLTISPLDLYFSLTDGSGSGDGNNSVVVSNFSCTSCPASPITLTDTQFFQDSTNAVILGPQLTFTLSFTENVDSGGIPDTFEWKLLDPSAPGGPTAIATNDPVTGEDLLTFDIVGPGSPIQTYGSADPNSVFGAPTLGGVPEPSGTLLFLSGLAVLLFRAGCFRTKVSWRTSEQGLMRK